MQPPAFATRVCEFEHGTNPAMARSFDLPRVLSLPEFRVRKREQRIGAELVHAKIKHFGDVGFPVLQRLARQSKHQIHVDRLEPELHRSLDRLNSGLPIVVSSDPAQKRIRGCLNPD